VIDSVVAVRSSLSCLTCVCLQRVISCRARPVATVRHVTGSAQSRSTTGVVIHPRITLCRLAGPSLLSGSFSVAHI